MIDQSILRERWVGVGGRHVGLERPADPGAAVPPARGCGPVRDQPGHVPRRRRERGLRPRPAPGPAADVRRRLLRLRPARDGLCRSGRRGRPAALRLHGAGAGDRGRGRAHHRLAGPSTRRSARPGRWWPRAMRGSTRPPARCSARRRGSAATQCGRTRTTFTARHRPEETAGHGEVGCDRLAAAVLALVVAAPAGLAQPAHGIAMHGEPAYPPDFTHFGYVDPDAPKGGSLVMAAIGSFDNLNPYIVRGTAGGGRRAGVRDADHAVQRRGRSPSTGCSPRPSRCRRTAPGSRSSCGPRRAGTTASR